MSIMIIPEVDGAQGISEDHENLAATDPIAQEQMEQQQDHELLQEALSRLPADKKEP